MDSHEPEPDEAVEVADPVGVLTEVLARQEAELGRIRKVAIALGVGVAGLAVAVAGLIVWNYTQETRLTVTGDYVIGKGMQRDQENAARQEELRQLACRLLAGTETWGNAYYDGLRSEYGCLPAPSPAPASAPTAGPTPPSSSPNTTPATPRMTTAPSVPTSADSTPAPGASTSNSPGQPTSTVQPTGAPSGSVPPVDGGGITPEPPDQVCVLFVCLPPL